MLKRPYFGPSMRRAIAPKLKEQGEEKILTDTRLGAPPVQQSASPAPSSVPEPVPAESFTLTCSRIERVLSRYAATLRAAGQVAAREDDPNAPWFVLNSPDGALSDSLSEGGSV